MSYFEAFTSNTLAAGGNQTVFHPVGEQVGRVFYRVFAGGTYRYSLLFSDVIDSTFADGSISRAGDTCGGFTLTRLAMGVCDTLESSPSLQPITVGGVSSYTLKSGETVATDPLVITAAAGQYLCIEIGFYGHTVPCHAETQIPVFVKRDNAWIPSCEVPLPSMVGCDRPVKHRVAYWGDSITQGIGVEPNSYRHWNALVSERLGRENSYWNLGLGFGRAMDAALDGSWLRKACTAEAVVLCFGVNDMGRRTAQQICEDLTAAVTALQAAGCRVLLQTVPPFEYSPEARERWQQVNRYLRTVLRHRADAFFDVETALGSDPKRYGGHPNEEGCRVWAEGILKPLGKLLENLDK
ncbi:MAG: SGNH/GDSL hydrolase family protein [Clostridia bacterium]|nr:SGNH/GDSL hydrolase family protein [Clostridia bacterium]